MNLIVANSFKKLKKVKHVPLFMQLGPGPSNYSVSVMHALLNQPVSFANDYLYETIDEIQEMTRYVYQTKNQFTLAAQFSGNGGNEALLVNLTEPGSTVIVAATGYWGKLVADMGRRHNLNVVELTRPLGEVFGFDELKGHIIKHKPAALFVTHGESSTGTLQPLEGLGKLCHQYDCLLIVDAVISFGVVPLLVDEWEVDAVNAATQKGLGAPVGMCLITLSDRAYKRMMLKNHPVPYIFDLKLIGAFWGCYGTPRRYVCSYSFNMLCAVKQALKEICEEGLENVWNRHMNISKLFMEKVKELGCEDLIKQNKFYGTNFVVLPEDVDWKLLLNFTTKNYNIEFSYGFDSTENKAVRIAFLAQNAKPEIVEHFLEVLQKGMAYCRKNSHLAANFNDPNKYI